MSILSLNDIIMDFEGSTVLNNINFSVEKGEMVAITGEDGSGKSTLLNILGLFLEPTFGDYYLFNEKNIGINSKQAMLLRRKKIGYLFQDYVLVDDMDVRYNLLLALAYKKLKKKEKETKIDEVLQQFVLSDIKSKKICQLDNGQKQKVALIRLILQSPELILADEPTGSLDNKNKTFITECLQNFQHNGKTVIIATHDDYIVNNCTRKIAL